MLTKIENELSANLEETARLIHSDPSWYLGDKDVPFLWA